jgi:hypothetical protein
LPDEKYFTIYLPDGTDFCSGNPMTPSRVTLALVFVMVAVLLAAGCVGQAGDGKNQTMITSPALQESPIYPIVTPTVATSCIPEKNTTPWIRVNPISNHHVGDVFTISGTTNIDPGSVISIAIFQSSFNRCPKIAPECYNYTSIQSSVKVIEGNCGINNWSFPVNLSGIHPNYYSVNVDSEKWKIHNITEFSIFLLTNDTLSQGSGTSP